MTAPPSATARHACVDHDPHGPSKGSHRLIGNDRRSESKYRERTGSNSLKLAHLRAVLARDPRLGGVPGVMMALLMAAVYNYQWLRRGSPVPKVTELWRMIRRRLCSVRRKRNTYGSTSTTALQRPNWLRSYVPSPRRRRLSSF